MNKEKGFKIGFILGILYSLCVGGLFSLKYVDNDFIRVPLGLVGITVASIYILAPSVSLMAGYKFPSMEVLK